MELDVIRGLCSCFLTWGACVFFKSIFDNKESKAQIIGNAIATVLMAASIYCVWR